MPMAVNRGRRTTDDHAWRQEYRRKERKGKETWKGNWTRGKKRREIKKKERTPRAKHHVRPHIEPENCTMRETDSNQFFFFSFFLRSSLIFFLSHPKCIFLLPFFFFFIFSIAKLQVLQNENLCNHGYRCLFTSVVFQKRKIAIEIKEALWLTEWISAQSFLFFFFFPLPFSDQWEILIHRRENDSNKFEQFLKYRRSNKRLYFIYKI